MAVAEITLAGFELIEKLGQGAMGVVWKARQLSLDRLVAIKVIPPEVIRSPDDVRMILQEARTAARLKHSGIVQIYDACEQNGTYFLVMEYVEGYNLGQWLARRKHLGVKDVLVVAEAVAAALDHAWQTTGLMHCDIKPENIMVDQDGTIKVADLGLSRTRDSKDGCPDDEVMGTPAYMSPEQIQGGIPLDCRTDIYSLGAMMYQLLTGKRPFSDKSDAEAMESQITSQIPDPRDIIPGIPACVCYLVERMMVKNREGRPADWSKALADLRRVSKGLMPLSPAPGPGASTMVCRKVVAAKGETVVAAQGEPRRGGRWRLPLLLLVLAAAGSLYWFGGRDRGTGQPAGSGTVFSVTPKTEPEPERVIESMQMFEEARRWSRANSRAYDAAFARYRAVVDRFPDTQAAALALEEMKKLRAVQSGEVGNAWRAIEARANQFVQDRKIEEALRYVENYPGPWAAETASNRMEMAKSLRRQKVEGEMARIEGEQWKVFLDKMAELVLAVRLRDALDELQATLKAGTYPRQKETIEGICGILTEALEAPARIRQSFEADVGRALLLPVGRTQMQMRIVGISGQKIAATLVDSGAQVLIHPDDLPVEERLRRMGDPASPGIALAKGVVAAGARMFPLAEEMFGRTGAALSGVLLEKLRLTKGGMGTDQVVTALARMLAAGGVVVGPYSEAEWVKAIEQARPTRERLQALTEQREKFLAEYGASECAVKMAPVLLALERQCLLWAERKDIQAETPQVSPRPADPAESGVQGVIRRLVERNPGINAKQVTPYTTVSGGEGLRVVSDSIVDVGALGENCPVKGLWLETKEAVDLKIELLPLVRAGLWDLRLKGYIPRDANNLRGMGLRHLTITGINTPSYTWLEGLPLVELDLAGSGIRELNSLRGMKLEKLILEGAKVTGVTPLAGMPLRELNCRGTAVRDISVLRGLPLVSLDLSQTPVTECSVLRGMNLASLDLSKTGVRDISFCGAMPLERLALAGTPVEDITCLRGKNLKRLILSRSGVTDISALTGAAIGTLDLSGTRIPPINLLRTLPRMKVQELSLEDLDVSRVDFLKGQPLTRLSLKGTKVMDINPLAGMPLKILDLRGLRLLDMGVFDSLRELESLWCDMEPLQIKVMFDSHPRLQNINGTPRPDVVRW